jgi:Holliday junction DNA helicase RuvA
MIGRLSGTVLDKGREGVVVDVGGVGYDVALPLSTLAALPATGAPVTLWIHTHVREDELRLFGFGGEIDRAAFRTMLKVSGVGPKVAMAVLGALSGDQLAVAVEAGDTRRLTAIPGIGKKTAERIILELGGKLTLGTGAPKAGAAGVLEELSSALKNLGFKPARVDQVIAAMERQGGVDRPFEDLLREGLGLLQGTG